MSYLHALLIGILQGITEFFPVSSSAHLTIFKALLGAPKEGAIIFDLFCHLGTLFALLIAFRRDILSLLFQEHKKLFLLVLATIPLVPAYFLFKPLRESARESGLLGLFLIATGAILFVGSIIKLKPSSKPRRTLIDAVLIGASQGTALIPGISRSASTISCATILGWDAAKAVKFSFMLSIPTVLGGCFVETTHLFSAKTVAIDLTSCLIGFSSALMSGLLILPTAIKILELGKLRPFAWYCLFLGALVYVIGI